LSGCPKSRALETYRDLDLTQPTSRSSFTTIISSPKRLQIVNRLPNGNFVWFLFYFLGSGFVFKGIKVDIRETQRILK
jgi:hypothetical protein